MNQPLPPPLLQKRKPRDGANDIGVFDADDDVRIPANKLRRARAAMVEMVRRKYEALTIYQPLPKVLTFHRSHRYWRLLVGSNRSGKSQGAAAEVAWVATGTHPYVKYPKENALIYALAQAEKDIKEVMWPKLGLPGSFKMIRDEQTNAWRPVLPDNEYDSAYSEKWRDAPPFIPPRAIKDIAWTSKKDGIPNNIVMKNGSRIQFFSSRGLPQKGSSIDLAWIDEEIERAAWIPELEARCIDKSGRLFWSFTPEVATEMAYVMHQRAIAPGSEWDISEYHLLILENSFISEEKKRRFRQGLRTKREIDTKWLGKFALQGAVVYPEYSEEYHHVKSFSIPETWSRFMVVDPGVQVCAVLFCAVPPPDSSNANEVHFYDELYIRRCSAKIFAREVKGKLGHLAAGGLVAFVIDHMMGRQSEHGTGTTVESQYSDALQEEGVYSQETGTDFLFGSNDISGREGALRNWLEPRHDTGKATLCIHEESMPNLIWEFGQQFYKKDTFGNITDKRINKNDHLITCAEYIADMDPEWHEPPRGVKTESLVMRKIRELKGALKKHSVSLGPPK